MLFRTFRPTLKNEEHARHLSAPPAGTVAPGVARVPRRCSAASQCLCARPPLRLLGTPPRRRRR
eukprot:5472466-Prymnesium_polylepis.1